MRFYLSLIISLILSIGAFANGVDGITVEDFIVKHKDEAEFRTLRPRFFLYKSFSKEEYSDLIGDPVNIVRLGPTENPFNTELDKVYYDGLEVHCATYYGYNKIISISILGTNYQTFRGITVGDTVQDIINKYGDAHKVRKNEDMSFSYFYQMPDPFANNFITGLSLEFIVKQEGQKMIITRINISRPSSI